MRNSYTQILKRVFSDWVLSVRGNLGITQEEMADRLLMSWRSYCDLDNGYSCCSGLTLALFLTRICTDPILFLKELDLAFSEIDRK